MNNETRLFKRCFLSEGRPVWEVLKGFEKDFDLEEMVVYELYNSLLRGELLKGGQTIGLTSIGCRIIEENENFIINFREKKE